MDVRMVGATNRELEIAIKEGRFREELVRIVVPALRDRPADILPLYEQYLASNNLELGQVASQLCRGQDHIGQASKMV